ncbi:hypothetical protein ACSBR1_015477 [Camellia fascicularis]
MEQRRYGAREEGGWQPVLRRQGRVGRESMDLKGLYSIFNNFGVVKDVYISFKRRKQTRSQFGFVRYDFPIAA